MLEDVRALDKDVPIPLYYQLKQFVLEQIGNGQWATDHQIPSEQQFCEKFGISRPTVRQAINELIVEGHLQREQRKVIIPKSKMSSMFFGVLQSFDAEVRSKDLTPTTKVLNLGIRTNELAAKKLGLSKDEPCIFLERIRFADGDPIVWVETYLPHKQMPDLLDTDFEKVPLYEAIEGQYQMRIERVSRVFEAAAATSHEAQLLEVKKGSPICFVNTIAYDQKDKPIEYSIARYRGDKNRFTVEIKR